MPDAPYALALAAGLLAAVNPCGFALLPAYLSFLILDGAPDGGGRGRAAGRALTLTAAMTVGFVAVFGGFGLLAAPAANTVARHLPWVSVAVGLTLAAAGGWLLAGRQLPTFGLKMGTGPEVTRRFGAMALFGASYAIASLGCTIGPFLAVVVAGFRTDSIAAGVGLFLAYAAGMSLVVGPSPSPSRWPARRWFTGCGAPRPWSAAPLAASCWSRAPMSPGTAGTKYASSAAATPPTRSSTPPRGCRAPPPTGWTGRAPRPPPRPSGSCSPPRWPCGFCAARGARRHDGTSADRGL